MVALSSISVISPMFICARFDQFPYIGDGHLTCDKKSLYPLFSPPSIGLMTSNYKMDPYDSSTWTYKLITSYT